MQGSFGWRTAATWAVGGAGDGNRTRVTSLEGSSSAIELHPRRLRGVRVAGGSVRDCRQTGPGGKAGDGAGGCGGAGGSGAVGGDAARADAGRGAGDDAGGGPWQPVGGSLEEPWDVCEAVAFAVPPDMQAELAAVVGGRDGVPDGADPPVRADGGGRSWPPPRVRGGWGHAVRRCRGRTCSTCWRRPSGRSRSCRGGATRCGGSR
jgi:hypothetical protein